MPGARPCRTISGIGVWDSGYQSGAKKRSVSCASVNARELPGKCSGVLASMTCPPSLGGLSGNNQDRLAASGKSALPPVGAGVAPATPTAAPTSAAQHRTPMQIGERHDIAPCLIDGGSSFFAWGAAFSSDPDPDPGP